MMKKKDTRHKQIGGRKRALSRYAMIIYRTTHTDEDKNKCYKGVDVKISKEDFVTWFMENDFEGCSVDRIDVNKGYEVGNLQLIKLADNIRKDKVKAVDGMCECYRCKLTMALDLFAKDNRRANGRSTICKTCDQERRKKPTGVN